MMKVGPLKMPTATKATQTESEAVQGSSTEIVTLDIGGQIFHTRSSTLSRYPGSVLSNLTPDHSTYQADRDLYFFDRNAHLFQFILDAYRKGNTHFPHNYCHLLVREELRFWHLSENVLCCCCFSKLRAAEVGEKTLLGVASKLNTNFASMFVDLENTSKSKWRRMQLKVWYFMEDPNSSIYAKTWGIFFMMVVVIQLINQTIQTHPSFRTPNSFNSTKAYSLTNNTKLLMYYTTNSVEFLSVTHEVCVAIFMLEWCVRLLVCPKKIAFIMSLYNIIDFLAIVPLLVEVCLSRYVDENSNITMDQLSKILFALSVMGIFRVVRLFKFGRHFVPVKIMFLSLRASFREIIFLFMILSSGMLIFATLIYWVELYTDGHFDSIPTGLWWSLITMSTVGYGDLYPTSSWGYLIGSLCAVVGMLVTGLPIPIIANNFSNYYSYASVHLATVQSKKFIKTKRNVSNKLKSFKFHFEISDGDVPDPSLETTAKH